MTISFSKRERNLIVTIKGDIDHHSAEEIRDQMEKELLKSGCTNMVLNFSQVDFMDSSGIGIVIGRYKLVKNLGGEMAVVGVQDKIDRIFLMSGLYKIIRKYSKIDEALESM